MEKIKLFFLGISKYWNLFLLGLGAVVGYFVFFKKDKIELKDRPEDLKIDMPKRPNETDFQKKIKKKIDKIEGDRKKITDRHSYLDMINRNY